MDSLNSRVAVIAGDGAGPELSDAARTVLVATGVELDMVDVDVRDLGLDAAAPILRDADAVLKGPLATAQDGSEPSLNIGLKRVLGLHTQVRRIRSIGGGGPVAMDVSVVRQATEGLLAGIGVDQGPDSRVLADLLGRPELADASISFAAGTEAATRRTFEVAVGVAQRAGTGEYVVAHKAAAVPHRDGMFVAVGRSVGERAGISVRAMAVDGVAARLVTNPGEFGVIVAPNLYGDILSDVAGAVAGSVALVAGMNIGDDVIVFEAAHGVVTRHAGRDTADPTGLVLSAAMLLDHLGHHEEALAIETAVHDTMVSGTTPSTVGTRAFAAAVGDRL